MEISPTESVRGMTELDRSRFTRAVQVPSVRLDAAQVGRSLKTLRKYLLKIDKLKPVMELGIWRR